MFFFFYSKTLDLSVKLQGPLIQHQFKLLRWYFIIQLKKKKSHQEFFAQNVWCIHFQPHIKCIAHVVLILSLQTILPAFLWRILMDDKNNTSLQSLESRLNRKTRSWWTNDFSHHFSCAVGPMTRHWLKLLLLCRFSVMPFKFNLNWSDTAVLKVSRYWCCFMIYSCIFRNFSHM